MRQKYQHAIQLRSIVVAEIVDSTYTKPRMQMAKSLGIAALAEVKKLAGFPIITVRQPQPFDLVDDPVEACGIGTGFEAVFAARVRDANGNELAQVPIHAGGTGIWGNFHAALALGAVPATPHGVLEVYGFHGGDGSEINKIIVPITFGRALVDPYHGFAQHEVVSGESLSAIAQHWYGDTSQWPRLYEANRNQIADPNLIFPGQVLRVPQ